MISKLDIIKEQMENLMMKRFTRWVGNPAQKPVFNMDQFLKKVGRWNGNCSCFVTVNSFPETYIKRNLDGFLVDEPYEISIERILCDLDVSEESKFDWVCRRLDELNLSYAIVRTGGKGFQFHVMLKPKTYKFETDFEKELVKQKIVTVAKWLFKYGKGIMKGIDRAVTIDPRRIGRVPGCMYYFHSGLPNGMYSVVIKKNQYSQSLNMCKNNIHSDVYPRNDITLDKLIEENNLKVEEITWNKEKSIALTTNKIILKDKLKYVELLGMRYPCVKVDLMTNNPSHIARESFGMFMHKIGKSLDFAKEVYAEMANAFDYRDRGDTKKRDVQLKSCYNYNDCPSCTKLKAANRCIGKKCPRYRGR